jgi:Rad52/22 family double-strand break repair protein
MALSDTQVRQLRAKLDGKHVKTRSALGADLHYVEGWHVIAEANRIFGYDAWDRRTLASHCVWSGQSGANYTAAYTAKVRVSVRAGDITIVREGSGTGEGKAPTPGQAHELALKGAETDATKRALATFGNPFGLALYDREQLGVRKVREKASPPIGPWVLRSALGSEEASFEKPSEFAGALRSAMTEAHDIELLFAIWEQNVETVRALNRSMRQAALPKSGIAPQLVNHLKGCAIALVKPENRTNGQSDKRAAAAHPRLSDGARPKIDKSGLTFSEPKRIRCKEHLRFVASQPCLICGRTPSHAHHVRYAQSRGLSLKVSDEFTVPLCAIHHNQIHTTGKEGEWWQERNIDPLKVANALWQKSRERYPAAREDFPGGREESADARPKGGQASDYDSKRGLTASTDDAP